MAINDPVTADPCLLCGATGRHVVETMGRGFKPLVTVACDGCGLVSHHPLPDPAALEAFYAERYRLSYKGVLTPKPKHSLRAQRGAAARARRLAGLIPAGARVLDVGASSGEFVFAMQRSGFHAVGLEPNRGYAQFAAATYGVEIVNRPLEPDAFGPGAFDLIHINHVLEHLADPLAALGWLRHWLTPDGLVFVEVPNLEGVRKQRATLFHDAHIWNFTPQTLIALAARAGLVPIAGEDLAGTSLVFARAAPVVAPAVDPGHADAIRRQLATEQSATAYVTSGAAFGRRWRRLLRNIDELATVRRHASIRAMGEAVVDAAGIRPGARAYDRAA
jgi:2-polyprenyl-3-methyl-5-hydroxy-6-metoxy-1,4-benzoquinol methylase